MSDPIANAFSDMNETAADYLAKAEEIAARKKRQRNPANNVVEIAREAPQERAQAAATKKAEVPLEQLTTRIPVDLRRTLKQAAAYNTAFAVTPSTEQDIIAASLAKWFAEFGFPKTG